MIKLIRVTTVPQSLRFCAGLKRLLADDDIEVVAVSSPGDILDEYGQSEGVRTIAVPMERHISPFKDMKSLWNMWRVLRRESPVMVHSMTPKAGMISMIAAWIARGPVRIHTFTGLVFPTSSGLKRRILMATDWLTCACATHVIPEGEGVKADLLNNRITKKDIRVLGYGNVKGVDLNYFNPEGYKDNKDESCFTFVFVGRLVGDKGINELVSAFKRLNNEHRNTRLVLVGGDEANLDPLRADTLAEIERNPSIENVGRQNDVRSFYASADALVFPSYREGFPNVVLEAGAMGLPSIVTDINGSREIMDGYDMGFIVPQDDIEAFADRLSYLIENPYERQRMGAAAFKRSQDFDRDKILDQYEALYRSLIK